MNPVTIPVRPEVLDATLKFVELTSAFGKKALDELATRRAAEKKASDLRPGILDHMLKSNVVPDAKKQAADDLLATYDGTMILLKSAVDKIASLQARAKGQDPGMAEGNPGEKAAGDRGEFNSLTNNMVGARTSFVRESDKPLLALIGQG